MNNQELRSNFEEGLMVLTNMFWNAAQLSHLNKELKKVHVLVQLQEHLLNQKHMRQEVKPLIVIKDVSKTPSCICRYFLEKIVT